MASNTRKQLEAWLKTLDITGSVADVGGSALPVRGRTKSWKVTEYDIWDIKAGTSVEYVRDFNEILVFDVIVPYDNVFCLEVMEYIYDPMTALKNLRRLLKKGGRLFISTHFLFPHHAGGADLIRFTGNGIQKLLIEAGFKIVSITPRMAVDNSLPEALDLESKIQYHRGEIGHLIEAC